MSRLFGPGALADRTYENQQHRASGLNLLHRHHPRVGKHRRIAATAAGARTLPESRLSSAIVRLSAR